MPSTNSTIVGRSPIFALDRIQPKLSSFLFSWNAVKGQRIIHKPTSTSHNNTRHHHICTFILFQINTIKMSAILSVLPTSRSRRPRVLACDVTVKRPISRIIYTGSQQGSASVTTRYLLFILIYM